MKQVSSSTETSKSYDDEDDDDLALFKQLAKG
jgi:hypothetical protein